MSALAFATSSPTVLMGTCLEPNGPGPDGRFRILYQDADGRRQSARLAALEGVSLGQGDRGLLLWPDNWSEPVIVGALRAGPPAEPRPRSIHVNDGETLRVTSGDDDRVLLEIVAQPAGPVLRLGSADLRLETPGNLEIDAQTIRLKTRAGDVKIEAAGEVVVQGQVIRLN